MFLLVNNFRLIYQMLFDLLLCYQAIHRYKMFQIRVYSIFLLHILKHHKFLFHSLLSKVLYLFLVLFVQELSNLNKRILNWVNNKMMHNFQLLLYLKLNSYVLFILYRFKLAKFYQVKHSDALCLLIIYNIISEHTLLHHQYLFLNRYDQLNFFQLNLKYWDPSINIYYFISNIKKRKIKI